MIGLYALEETLEVAAFAHGLGAATIPYKYRNHNFFHRNEIEDFDCVVVSGLRGKGMEIRDAYNALGVPVVVIDYGYMRRVSGVATWATGHWQVGLNRLGWVPPIDCPSDRFDAIGIDLKEPHDGEYILVCGQHAGDPSHGLDAQGISKWATSKIAEAKAATEKPVYWRPHPDSPEVDAEGHDGISKGPINWDEVDAIHCINSNTGHEALINGVRVFSEPSASYNGVGFEDRPPYFARLAYAQWTLEEMRQGKAQEFILNQARRLR